MNCQIDRGNPLAWAGDGRMAQTSGPAKPGAAVFKAEWEWIRAAIAEALRPYPEALAAVVKALGQWDRVG